MARWLTRGEVLVFHHSSFSQQSFSQLSWLFDAAERKQSNDFFGGGAVRWDNKRKKEEEIAEIIEKEIESIIEEKIKVISRKQNAKPEYEDYWSLHLYENLLNTRIAEITTDILLQKIRDNAINAIRQKAIEEALFKRQLEIERALFIEYQRIIEEDMIFVFSMLAEM